MERCQPTTGCGTPLGSHNTGLTTDKSGSFIAEGKWHSARAKNTLVGGLPVADELVLERAMKRAAARNLDGVPASQTSASPTHYSGGKFLKDICIDNLNSIGVLLGHTSNAINLSYSALKRIHIDKTVVQHKPQSVRKFNLEDNPFDLSDGEDYEINNDLLSHLVKDLMDVDLDDLDLDTKICDLQVSGRRTKSASKKNKGRHRQQKQNNKVTQ
jgi:hypothetical protein